MCNDDRHSQGMAPMTERIGRARPYLIIAPILAAVLLGVAIVVAVGGPGAFDAASTPTPALTSVPSLATGAPVSASPSAVTDVSLPCALMPAPSAERDGVLVYFDCGGPPNHPRPVVRSVGDAVATDERLRLALGALLDGPRAEERALGYSGFLPSGSAHALNGVAMMDATAIIDFSTALTTGALNASSNRFVVFETLGATIRQFADVESVEFRIDGECAAFASYFESTCTFVRARSGLVGDWLLIGGTTGSQRVVMSGAEPITIEIDRSSLRGRGPCNIFGAPLDVDGTDIEVGSIEASEALCADDVMAREGAYLGAIGRATTARLEEGLLILTGPQVELRYAELNAVLPGE
jgi:heat shock protein HslJ